MARLGATVWTGDINPNWGDMQTTPGMVLNWGLAGGPYVACDIGGFTGETQADLLARWCPHFRFFLNRFSRFDLTNCTHTFKPKKKKKNRDVSCSISGSCITEHTYPIF